MRALVTGGGGFIGSRIVRMLHARGDEVAALGRSDYPELRAVGIHTVQTDIRDARAVRNACAGVDVVFHTAAIAAIWGPAARFRAINVDGTQNVIDACAACGVTRLVYTSTPSVVFGEDELCGVDESQPYPLRYLAHYPATKAEAERRVLAANGTRIVGGEGVLSTVALRPHLVWGPGDPHLIPRIIERARRGKLRRVGTGENLVDITYIDNAAAAHLLAADALAPNSPCGGRAYFISQGEPVRLWPWLNEILEAIGVRPVERSIAYGTARRIGGFLEMVYRLIPGEAEPPMTRFVAAQLATSHYFDISRARRDFGYRVGISTADGFTRLIDWLGKDGRENGGAPRTGSVRVSAGGRLAAR